MEYLIISDEQMCDGWISHRHDGSIEFRYRDHHGVKQEERCVNMDEARYRQFRWKLIRSLFIEEWLGGNIDEVAELHNAPILTHEDEAPTAGGE